MKFFDITRPLTSDLASWPGDVSFDYRLVGRLSEGASVNLGRVTTSVHSGTHADAFFHFDDRGLTMEQLAPERYLGPAAVVDLTAKFAGSLGEITIADLAEGVSAPRLLLKTGAWPDSTKFPEAIPVLARGVAEWMQSRGVKLLGLDLPSVDAIDSKDLRNHHALQAADIAILEGLDLSAVEAGAYSLAALPLKIVGGDGAPVRAVLWRDE
ncbi:MAG TPA: cyclase family protein [Chthoniobacterales bacterium]|jgi:arylformamidase|nr:cyclase family protein [Chthoniobacterales bacterium]